MIPKWTSALIKGEALYINGDGETSRDFCYVDNAVQANLLAATVDNEEATNQVYNVAIGDRTTLNELYRIIAASLRRIGPIPPEKIVYRDFRNGDVRHSQAEIQKAKTLLGYEPSHHIRDGLNEAMAWYSHKQG